LGVCRALTLEVFGLQTCVLRDASEHAKTDFFTVVKGEDEIW
jgi:hypothetical protein